MLIAIPSKGRATHVQSLKVLHKGTLFVPEVEADDYRLVGHADVVGVPVNGITKTRNFILDYAAERKIRRVVMIDDDVKVAGYVLLLARKAVHRGLAADEWLRQFSRLFDVAEGFGYSLWGVATQSAPRSVYPYKPFITQTYVTGSCMGMVSNGPRFDETFPVKEDYELCLRMIRDEGGVLGARYLYWENEHWTTEGGCLDYRDRPMEEAAIARLQKMYPGIVRQINRGGADVSIELRF